jgi:trk system potassium uptake protein
VSDLPLPTECILAAVIREGRLIIPHGDTILHSSDEVLAVVHSSKMAELASLLGEESA